MTHDATDCFFGLTGMDIAGYFPITTTHTRFLFYLLDWVLHLLTLIFASITLSALFFLVERWDVVAVFRDLVITLCIAWKMEKVYMRFIDRSLSKLHSVGVSLSNILHITLKRTRVSLLYMLLFIQSPPLRIHFLSPDPPFCP